MAQQIQHIFTVDVEDWFHGIPISSEQRSTCEKRLPAALDRLFRHLSDAGVRGTFFWLGEVAQEYPELVRRTVDLGHEVGCHGWHHEFVYRMTPDEFRTDMQQAIGLLEKLSGKPVTSYRAPYFSITKDSQWALDILAELCVDRDSSIFPVRNWRYGIPGFSPEIQELKCASGTVTEFPISVRSVAGVNLPVGGGAYFRLYPYWLTRQNIRALERQGQRVVFYLHPWELDPEHPRITFSRRAQATHYLNLRSTEPKLRRLLSDFKFGPLVND